MLQGEYTPHQKDTGGKFGRSLGKEQGTDTTMRGIVVSVTQLEGLPPKNKIKLP